MHSRDGGSRVLVAAVRMGWALLWVGSAFGCGTRIAHTTKEPPADPDADATKEPPTGADADATKEPPTETDADAMAEPPAETDADAMAEPDAGAMTEPPDDADADRPSESSVACASTLAGRLAVTQVTVDSNIRYKKGGYNLLLVDRRIAFAVQPNGDAWVAWLDDALANVHVTPLSSNQTRRGPDVVVSGVDLGGLVAHDDGFALLTRRADPGEPLTDPNMGVLARAAFLARVRMSGTAGTETFAAPLTGTAAITDYTGDRRRDCAEPILVSRLAHNGDKYGAYFAVHGCSGHPYESHYADKLVYVDATGRYVTGGWDWNCSINQGLRLLPEPDAFTSVCLSDSQPYPGLNLVTVGKSARQLAPEETWTGYCAGQLGSIVRIGDGYVIGWLSRGIANDGGSGQSRAAKVAPDIAIIRLGRDLAPVGSAQWLFETPDVAEANLHLAPYGPDRIVVVWDSVASLRCSSGTCRGEYTGTHVRLMDANGTFSSPDELIHAPPNGDDDLVVYPNGDVGWAFVPELLRDYSSSMTVEEYRSDKPSVPAMQQIGVARLRYCPE